MDKLQRVKSRQKLTKKGLKVVNKLINCGLKWTKREPKIDKKLTRINKEGKI